MSQARMAALLATLLMASSLATAGIVLGVAPTLTVTPSDTTITVGDTTNATADITGYVAGDGTGTITIALFSDSGGTKCARLYSTSVLSPLTQRRRLPR